MEGTIFSLLPPLTAIVLCIVFKRAITALFAGVLVGAFLLARFDPFSAIHLTATGIILPTVTDHDNIVNLMFTTTIGGVVGILNFSPSSTRLLNHISGFLRNRAKTGIVIWCTGFLFFIDDYANALIVGNAFRKVVDRFRISREKLAFIVDTTSAPVASLALVSTWIGFEISVINDALAAQNIQNYTGYGVFISTMPYRFYPWLALFFCLLICWMQKDYGAMLKAEERALSNPIARNADSTDTENAQPFNPREWLIILPLILLIVISLSYMIFSGILAGAQVNVNAPLQSMINILSECDPFMSLLVAAVSSSIVSLCIHSFFIKERTGTVLINWLKGCQTMLMIDVILILAWSIGDVSDKLETGKYVASLFQTGFDPHYLPFLTFLCASAISFATGTSYGTMSILMPVAVPVVASMAIDDPAIVYGTIGSVLGGAIFGDHCSPLSDTTILSSGASGCDVTAHVNTQLPYALTVGLVSSFCLLLVPLETISVWWMLLTGMVILYFYLKVFGKRPLVDESSLKVFD